MHFVITVMLLFGSLGTKSILNIVRNYIKYTPRKFNKRNLKIFPLVQKSQEYFQESVLESM